MNHIDIQMLVLTKIFASRTISLVESFTDVITWPSTKCSLATKVVCCSFSNTAKNHLRYNQINTAYKCYFLQFTYFLRAAQAEAGNDSLQRCK